MKLKERTALQILNPITGYTIGGVFGDEIAIDTDGDYHIWLQGKQVALINKPCTVAPFKVGEE